jgi:hypothetical protein
MVEAMRCLGWCFEYVGDSWQPGAHLAHCGQVGWVSYVHVRDLVVGDGERTRGPGVQVLHAGLGVYVQQTF